MRAPGAGAAGFDEIAAHAEPPLAIGYVTGYRLFDMAGLDPDAARRTGELAPPAPGMLSGNWQGWWEDGENIATCGRTLDVPGHQPPHVGCGCGFWAYWRVADAYRVWSPQRPVLAAIQGYGRTRIGDLGFRCGKAVIKALHVLFDFSDDAPGKRPGTGPEHPDNLALLASVEDVLGQLYPGAEVCATERLLTARHPVPEEYAKSAQDRRRERWPAVSWYDHPPALPAQGVQRKRIPRPGLRLCAVCTMTASPGDDRCPRCAKWRDVPAGSGTKGFYTHPDGSPRDWPGRLYSC